MRGLPQVQAFIDSSRRVTDAPELSNLLADITREMGFDHFALIHHVDLSPFEKDLGHMASGELLALVDYPDSWVEQYIGDELALEDPVLLACRRTTVGFAWSEMPRLIAMKPSHLEILERGRRAGIGDGFTIPSSLPGEAGGSCNFVVKPGCGLPDSLMMAQLVGIHAFEAARQLVVARRLPEHPRTALTPRQIDCLVLFGRGKTMWETAQILGLAESTVKEYFDDARGRYGTSSRVQVLIRAVWDGHIPLARLLR